MSAQIVSRRAGWPSFLSFSSTFVIALAALLGGTGRSVHAVGFPDCNQNGIDDAIDIADCAGDPACEDCNGDGRPDECGVTNACRDLSISPYVRITLTDEEHQREQWAALATDAQGTWLSIWSSTEVGPGTNLAFSRSFNNGAAWSPPELLHPSIALDNRAARLVEVATDEAGSWVAVWSMSSNNAGTAVDIYQSRSSGLAESWTEPQALHANAGTVVSGYVGGTFTNPKITSDGAGRFIAVWGSDNSLGDTIDTDYDVLFSITTDGGANWSLPSPLNTNADVDAAEDTGPTVTCDGNGSCIAMWWSGDSVGGGMDDLVYSRSDDGGTTWSSPGTIHVAASNNGGLFVAKLAIAADGQGNWVATWQSEDSVGATIGDDSDIMVSASNDDGVSWTSPATLNHDASSDVNPDSWVRLSTDRAGTWAAIWQKADDLLYSVSGDGGANWSPAAPFGPTSTTYGFFGSALPRLETDRNGIWVGTWTDTTPYVNDYSHTNIVAARGNISYVVDDCDCDGFGDVCEIVGCGGDPLCGDCNFNWIPDGCEMDGNDCNTNGLHDACEDCNGNGLADECDIDGGAPDVNTNDILDECELQYASVSDDLDKSRVISVDIDAGAAGLQTAVRVRLVSLHHPAYYPPFNYPDFSAEEGTFRYLNLIRDDENQVVTTCPDSAANLTSYRCATLGCTPEYADWAGLFGGDTVHVSGAAIVPDSIYMLSVIHPDCAGDEDNCAIASEEIELLTVRWGESSSSYGSGHNITDVVSVVDRVRDIPGAIPERRCLVHPLVPDPYRTAPSVTDIVFHVDALRGDPYGFGIDSCP